MGQAFIVNTLFLTSRIIPFPGTDVMAGDSGIDCAMCGAFTSMQAFICMPPDRRQNSPK